LEKKGDRRGKGERERKLEKKEKRRIRKD